MPFDLSSSLKTILQEGPIQWGQITSIVNLFGLLPFDPHVAIPSFLDYLNIGVLPVLLGISFWVMQQRIDRSFLTPLRKTLFGAFPIFVALVSRWMSAAELIFFLAFNALSIAHEQFLMRRTPGLFGDVREYEAEVLPHAKWLPIEFLMWLAPNTISLWTFLVFWQWTKHPNTKVVHSSQNSDPHYT